MSESKKVNHQLELNPLFMKAFQLFEQSSTHVFLTGRAGTGKSTFLQYFREHTKKNVVVLAPTGVAALNVKGQTIHSFFNFKPDTTIDSVSSIRLSRNKMQILAKLDVLIIDEISMVRADLLDCIDAALRQHGRNELFPFGGVQIVFIGDLFQLPPVVRPNEKSIFETVYKSPYFFDAKSFKDFPMELIELEKNYRQKDEAFITILNAIRNNTLSQENLRVLNSRFLPNQEVKENEFYIYLTTTNDLADRINDEKLEAIQEELFNLSGEISGQFDNKNLPTHENLGIKVGAQVMLLNNDQNRRWINGSIGKVIAIDESSQTETTIRIELANGRRVDVAPFTWEIFQFFYNEEKGGLDSESIGSFRQYPIKLAWAVTIHKSQGKTFERVVIDFGRGTFSHGQTYVALSRCTTMEGILLKRPISPRDIFMDKRIPDFIQNYQYENAKRNFPEEKKREIFEKAIAQKRTLDIVYLKEQGEKNYRTVIPRYIRLIEHAGQKCLGLEAFCTTRQQDWIFRFPCIIDIQESLEIKN